LAIMVLQECYSNRGQSERKKTINQEVERIVPGNRDFAHRLCEGCLGLIETLIVKSILGEAIPSDIPKWMREEVRHRA
jgi:hypothetical protein